jgi:Flp pilus assembly protein TadG
LRGRETWLQEQGNGVKRVVAMRLFGRNQGKKTRGQTMVEFALILPLLLMTMYGVIEFGRLLFIYITTASATREAARYAAAVGIGDNGVPYYEDCVGIRDAAKRVGILAGIQDSDITILYDSGPGTAQRDACTSTIPPGLGDRIVVIVNGHFDLIVPMIPISIRDITSSTARTIIRDLTVGDSFVIAPPESVDVPPPYVHFAEPPTSVAGEPDSIPITVLRYDPDNVQDEPITVTINTVDIFEAKPNIDYIWGGPISLTFNPGDDSETFNITIIDDSLHEVTERIVLYISNVSNGNIGYPRLHVISINDNDITLPDVSFQTASSEYPENSPEFPVNVILSDSGVQASVRFRFLSGGLVPGDDFTYTPSDDLLIFGIVDNTYRTASQVQQIWINPIDDDERTGHRTIVIELHTPGEAELVDPVTHTLTLIDDESCNITLDNVIKSGNYFTADLWNNVHPVTGDGVSDVMTGMAITYTRTGTPPALQEIIFDGGTIFSGNAESPVTIPSALHPWYPGADLSLPLPHLNTPGNLVFQFTNVNVVRIDSISIDFRTCGTVSYP